MRRCLCSGRPLQIGRTINSRVLSFPPFSRSPIRPINNIQSISTKHSLAGKEFDKLLKLDSLPPIPLKGLSRKSPDAWITLVEECLQADSEKGNVADRRKSAASILDHQDDLKQSYLLSSYLYLARLSADLVLPIHIGFERKQWSTVLAIFNNAIDTYELLIPHMTPLNPSIGFDWNASGLSLDEISGDRLGKLEVNFQASAPDNVCFDILTHRPAARLFANRLLGQVFMDLGSLILEAADRPTEESKMAMSYVHRVLARLHHLDLISDRIYQYPEKRTSDIIFHPPALNLLSGHIMAVLSDAAWQEHQSAITVASTEAGEEPLFLPFKVGVRELGPEIWMELILWCCIEHGFTKYGASLIEEMMKRKGDKAWTAESWRPLINNLDVVRRTNISTEQYWRRSSNDHIPKASKRDKPPFHGLGNRTISLEVVSSLRDGLSNAAYNGLGNYGATPRDLLKAAAPLSGLLERQGPKDDLRPTCKHTNWNITRIMRSGCLRPEKDPLSFARLLRSTQNMVPPWPETDITELKQLDSFTRGQLYDESAAIAGLIEYSIKTFSYERQSEPAFAQFALLQSIADASKAHHIRAFFECLGQSDPLNVPFFDSEASPLSQSSLPQVSRATLADLLDLATSNQAYEFGEWLLFNDDLDGPTIPESAYGDQVLAPSLLRFASATNNVELNKLIVQSIKSPISVNTLKALVNVYFVFNDWERAVLTLQFLRDYRAKSWGFSNVTVLAREIIVRDAAIKHKQAHGGDVKDDIANLTRAKNTMLRFFNEEFNSSRGQFPRAAVFQQKVLQRLYNVFMTIPGVLPELLADAKLKHTYKSHQRLHYIPPVAFHPLLSAVVETQGSTAGMQVWMRWCRTALGPDRKRQREGGITRLKLRYENTMDFDVKWHTHIQEKAIVPNLNTIRIISRAAIKEYDLERATKTTSSSSKSPNLSASYKLPLSKFTYPHQTHKGGRPPKTEVEKVLDFCVTTFLSSGMPEHDVELEVPGYLAYLRWRGVFTGQGKHSRDSFKDSLHDPWIKRVATGSGL
ncbi:hypothetical protein N7495_008136 [Penicillium taxi]|uniref:uncharacterized protein n=1 Tax=Penicillium taxi TaxID=168475 RepID=UPI00254569AF|nr:uncharacterized protein N7495_008136 [Penicillium taxi]KAJ5888095.1 hypothetical protein N7495_008136 [Penicillium taxi]